MSLSLKVYLLEHLFIIGPWSMLQVLFGCCANSNEIKNQFKMNGSLQKSFLQLLL